MIDGTHPDEKREYEQVKLCHQSPASEENCFFHSKKKTIDIQKLNRNEW